MVKWPSGPRQVTANLYNRWFESNLHLHIPGKCYGRTAASKSARRGSIPWPGAKSRRVGKSGLIRLLWEQETEGSNPSTPINYMILPVAAFTDTGACWAKVNV